MDACSRLQAFLGDVSVPYDPFVYATDASMTKGAVTMLEQPAPQLLRALGEDMDEAAEEEEEHDKPCKTLDFSFDLVEVCGGSGVLSAAAARRGLRVCAPIVLSKSRRYNLEDARLIGWIFQMIQEKRFKAVVCEPVCRTFWPAQHPSSRSYQNPLGCDRKDRKTYVGNLLAFRCLAILWFCWRESVVALLEQPLLSKMAWLSAWRYLLSIGFQEAKINSCAFGSIHKKPFRWLGWGLPMHELDTPCPGGHHHVRIEGKCTKASAIYHPKLAEFIAQKIDEALYSKVATPMTSPRPQSSRA